MKSRCVSMNEFRAACLLGGIAASLAASAVDVSTDANRVESPLQVPLRRIGTLVARAKPIRGDRQWSISSTCLDRDFADFDQYKHLLQKLGIWDVRFQAGWAKCEKEKGKFDFAWLDEQVDFCLANGLNPMLETSYGNPIYEGGGGWDLSGGIPQGDEGLAAWDRWIDELAEHFKGRVSAWMMWNEPSNNRKNTPEIIASFNARTARIIKRHIPEASIGAFAFGGARHQEFVDCFEHLGADVRLFDRYIYHGYEKNPDTSYQYVTNIQAIIRRYAPHAIAWQGENGCPSEMSSTFALNKTVWSEYSQAKWDLRRMLGDLGHDVPSSVFTFCDFYHNAAKSTAHRVEMNRKGLVRANEAHEVVAIKRAYYSVQNCVTVFDPSAKRVAEPTMSVTDTNIALYEYEKSGFPIWVFWDKSNVPGDSFQTRPLTFYSTRAPLEDPVWIDLMTGRVFEFPKGSRLVHSQGVMYADVPVYDSPCILTERSAVEVVESRDRAVRLCLPGTVYAAPGVECSIYWANVLDTVKPQLYCFDTKCAVGRNQEERFAWTPAAEDAGRDVRLTVEAIREGEIVDRATTVIKVAKKPADGAKNVALATLAASLTGSRYPDFVLEGMKADGYPGFREVGSHSGGGNPVVTGGPAHDGYGGFTFGCFLSRWMMHESELPLLQDAAERDQLKALGLVGAKRKSYALRSPLVRIENGKKVVDVQAWLDKVNGGKAPEVIFIELGANQTFGATDDETLHRIVNEVQIPNARRLLGYLRGKCPNSLIGIALETLGCGQDGYAASYGCRYSEANWRRNLFVLNRALERFVRDSGDPRLMVVPFGHAISRDHSYLREEVKAHAYAEGKILRDRNALHCGAAGGHQLADAVRCWLETVGDAL